MERFNETHWIHRFINLYCLRRSTEQFHWQVGQSSHWLQSPLTLSSSSRFILFMSNSLGSPESLSFDNGAYLCVLPCQWLMPQIKANHMSAPVEPESHLFLSPITPLAERCRQARLALPAQLRARSLCPVVPEQPDPPWTHPLSPPPPLFCCFKLPKHHLHHRKSKNRIMSSVNTLCLH